MLIAYPNSKYSALTKKIKINQAAAMVHGTAMSRCSTFLYNVPGPPHDLRKEHVSSQGNNDGNGLNIRHNQQCRRNRAVVLRPSWFHEFELPQRK
jgi:hypothetical protein